MNGVTSHNTMATGALSARYYLYLFILWPFLALMTALLNFSQKEARTVIYLFMIYYGLTYVLLSTGYVDAVGYSMALKFNSSLPFSEFFKVVGGLYSGEDSMDIIEPLISFLVSRFTSDHRILFAAYAALFGFFYLKSITIVYNEFQSNIEINAIIHLIFLIVIVPITAINGVRFWTATWIFFYGAYNVVLHRDPKYFIVTLGASLMHWSFLSVNGILIIYYFLGNRNLLYFPMAIASFILPEIISPVFQRISLMLGGGIQGRYESYTDEFYRGVVQDVAQEATWFLKIGNSLVLVYLILAVLIIYFVYGNVMKGKAERNLFSFLLILLSFVNFGKTIPSFGGRFQLVFFIFATVYIILYFAKNQESKLNFITLLGIFPMILYTAIVFRQGSDSINAWIFAPIFGLPFFRPDISIGTILFN